MTSDKTCLYCGQPFTAKSRKALYCSLNCRVNHFRKTQNRYKCNSSKRMIEGLEISFGRRP